jgi:hypothetical protein
MYNIIKRVKIINLTRSFSNRISLKEKITQEKEENDLSKEIFKIENKHMNNECDEELDRLDQISKKHSEVN